MRSDRRLTIREMADELDLISYTIWSIWTEYLNMCWVFVKFIPKLLSDGQKERQLEVSQKLFNRAQNFVDPPLIFEWEDSVEDVQIHTARLSTYWRKKLLLKVETPLESVCSVTRRLLRRKIIAIAIVEDIFRLFIIFIFIVSSLYKHMGTG